MSQLTKKLAILEKKCADYEQTIKQYEGVFEQQRKLIEAMDNRIKTGDEIVGALQGKIDALEKMLVTNVGFMMRFAEIYKGMMPDEPAEALSEMVNSMRSAIMNSIESDSEGVTE